MIKSDKISRVIRSKDDARVFYSRISRLYDFSEGIFERKCIQMGMERLSVLEGDIVLDIGIGTGESSIESAKFVGHSGKVYCIDIATGMLKVTRIKLEKEGLLNRAELICSDAVHLPFQNNFFDKIFMSFTLELFDTPEIPKVLSECSRVLKNSAYICVVSLSKKNSNGIAILYEWLHSVFPRMFDCRPIYVEEAVNNAGFKTIDSSIILMCGLPVEIVVGEA